MSDLFCFAALGAFLFGNRLLCFHLALAGICFRSVLRYFLKAEYGLGRDCVYSESLRAGRSRGARECDMSRRKAFKHEQISPERRGNNAMPFLPRELDLICAQALPWRSRG